MQILHITPHLGGGVGSVLRSYLSFEVKLGINHHKVLSLESLNANSKFVLSSLGIDFYENMYQDKTLLNTLVSECDVLLIHWWNHPLLQELLMNFEISKNRMAIWCHISGSQSPNVICDYILDFPEEFIFTTPLSQYTASVTSNFMRTGKKISHIWSTVGFESIEEDVAESSKVGNSLKKRIGYIGNLDETKIHPEFFEIFSQIQNSEFLLDIVGPETAFFDNLSDSTSFKKFIKYGYVSESKKFQLLREIDVFAYPLARHHYGTCDQSIQEAMIFALPIVVFNNPMESFMIENGVTGLIARTKAEFTSCIDALLADKTLCRRLGQNAAKYARKHFSVQEMTNRWNETFQSLISLPKSIKAPLGQKFNRKLRPCEVMATSLGIHGQIFQDFLTAEDNEVKRIIAAQISSLGSEPSWRSPTKSTVNHYAMYFDDEILNVWNSLILANNL